VFSAVLFLFAVKNCVENNPVFLHSYIYNPVRGVYDDSIRKKGGCRMRCITLSQLAAEEVQVRELLVFPENWSRGFQYTRYQDAPRPKSGLFIVCRDVEVRYYPKDEPVVTAGKGDVLFIPRGVHYRAEVLGGKGDGIDTYTLNFHLLDEDGEELLLADRICVIAHRGDGLFAARAAALSSAVHRVDSSRLKVQAALYHFLDAVAASSGELPEDHAIRPGCDALRSEWNQNRKIEEYAALCGMSPACFYRTFRRCIGKSPVEYRNEIRVSNAETLLRHTELRIGEISRTVGFSDPYYFCRVFAAFCGLSPRKYRAAFRQEPGDPSKEEPL